MNEITIIDDISSNKFEELTRTIYEILVLYVKDLKRPDSWVGFYQEILAIKFPPITFNEGHPVFCERMTKILDLMELSHLYCKITNPVNYNKDNHQVVATSKIFIVSELEKLKLFEYEEMRQHLKNSILNGNN